MKLVVPNLNRRCWEGNGPRGAFSAARCLSSRVSAVCVETNRKLQGVTEPLVQGTRGADGVFKPEI